MGPHFLEYPDECRSMSYASMEHSLSDTMRSMIRLDRGSEVLLSPPYHRIRPCGSVSTTPYIPGADVALRPVHPVFVLRILWNTRAAPRTLF